MTAELAPLSLRETDEEDFAVVVIGRNEGERLEACLRSLGALSGRTVYVDSGSTDGSPALARRMGAEVVELDMRRPFTAARARNTGWRHALRAWPDIRFVQFVDGDCQVEPGWLDAGRRFLDERPEVAVVFGRRRERFPGKTLFNALCDREWDGEAGQSLECGGDVLVRACALHQAGGYTDSLIAGEEPELCVRLRARGWQIWRLDREMTLHDAAMTRLTQWWRRNKRAGHAFAEVSTLHWRSPHGIWRRSLGRALAWGALLPLATIAAGTLHPAAYAILLVYPLQVTRLAARERRAGRSVHPWRGALLDVGGKFAECAGALTFFANRIVGRRQRIIEYK